MHQHNLSQYAGHPSSPTNFKSSEPDSGVITLTWNSSESNIVDKYFIFITPPIEMVSTLTTCNTSITLAYLVYNQEYNVSLAASNCVGNSTPTEQLRIVIGNVINNSVNLFV